MMTDQEFMDLIETVQGAGIFSSASGTTISEDFKASLGV
jgi:hypothetical protein